MTGQKEALPGRHAVTWWLASRRLMGVKEAVWLILSQSNGSVTHLHPNPVFISEEINYDDAQ